MSYLIAVGCGLLGSLAGIVIAVFAAVKAGPSLFAKAINKAMNPSVKV